MTWLDTILGSLLMVIIIVGALAALDKLKQRFVTNNDISVR